ncbi:MAG: glycosyltransferase family 2 protein [Verrucomicrobia bacterium]|nr:glycosyltransferase family 2 protein [Verrucomicrobiota bacterium]
MKDVSVILPVKNAANTLYRAVRSIQVQTLENWELIIVDDGSEDKTSEILRELSASDPRIRVDTQQHAGIVAALNHGITCASGKFIARMDADDVSHPDRLRLQFSFLNENPKVGLAGTKINYMGDSEAQRGYAAYVDWTNSLLSWRDIRTSRFIESPFAHPSVMFRKSLLEGNSGPYRSGHFPEDYELWLRWMSQGITMAKLEETLLDWYDPPERLSRKDSRYDPKAFYNTKAKYLADWLRAESHDSRPLWVWGAGRITRKRAGILRGHGIHFSGYIDIDPRKTGSRVENLPVIQPEELDLSNNPYVISYVGNRGARAEIKTYLLNRGLKEEHDFIFAA